MANVEQVTTVHKYVCHNCDNTFYEVEPRSGYYFMASEGTRDDDGDVFFEGDKKVLIGTKTLACHNEESPCMISSDDWQLVECEGFKCTSCGLERYYDNDHCSAHDYSDRANARHDAINCCSTIKVEDSPKIDTSGDLIAMSQPGARTTKVTVIEG